MFQNSKRFQSLVTYASHRVKKAYDFDGFLEAIISLECLVRTETETQELDTLIIQGSMSFGTSVEDELEYLRG